jgi:hypothetical protein
MYVLLGVENGDSAKNIEKKTAFVGPVKRIDRKTMEVELKQGDEVDTFRVTEEPECVFELVAPVLVHTTGPGEPEKWEKATGKYKIDFSKAYGVTRGNAWGGREMLGLEGKRVGCYENECSDFAPLGGLDESVSTDERHLKAIEYFRSKYCPGSPY